MVKLLKLVAGIISVIIIGACSSDLSLGNKTSSEKSYAEPNNKMASQTSNKTGSLSLSVYEETVVNGNYAYGSKVFSNAGVYYNDLTPYGGPSTEYYTNENGKVLLTLPVGENTIVISKMTSSHSIFVSDVYTVYITSGIQTSLTLEVSPYTAKVQADSDVGYGNALYITGYGRLGWWTTAYKMTWINGSWVWSGNLPKGIAYKVIKYKWIDGIELSTSTPGIQWERGDNHIIDFVGIYTNNYIKPKF